MDFPGSQGISVCLGSQCPAAYQAFKFRPPQMDGYGVSVCVDVLFRESSDSILYRDFVPVLQQFLYDFVALLIFLFRQRPTVGLQEALHGLDVPFSAKLRHPPEIFCRYELPGRTEKVRADDPAFIEILFQ